MDIGPRSRFIFNKILGNRAASLVIVIALLAVTLLSFWGFFRISHFDFPQTASSRAAAELPLSWNWNDSSLFTSIPGISNAAVLRDSAAVPSVYPYSVIPGGVHSDAEFQAVLQRDPVIAAHYSDFRSNSAHFLRLSASKQVYVSYRLGDRIFWTRKKVTLRAGETLLTDGSHFARTRCGNRISEVPLGPASPAEPPTEVLDHPLPPVRPEFVPAIFPAGPFLPDGPSNILLAFNSAAQPPEGSTPFLPFLPLVPCCGPSQPHSSTSPPPPPGPGPSPSPAPTSYPGPLPEPFPPPIVPAAPIATPEPSPLLLLLVGATGLLAFWLFRRS
jgi:hypothetical protein